jgi:peptidoglycan hydrolase-like protein with peptidoglycan-binding domain
MKIYGSYYPQYPPQNLIVVSSGTALFVSWSAPKDATGITGYNIYRCDFSKNCYPSRQIANSINLSYTDTSVLLNAFYGYGITAYNSFKLESSKSNIANGAANGTWVNQNIENTNVVTNPPPDTTNPSTPSATYTTVFTKSLYPRVRDPEVTKLQQLLSKYPDIYPEAKVTGYYWSLTYTAVGRFQIKCGIVPKSPYPGYGLVGPKTRAKLNDVYNGK